MTLRQRTQEAPFPLIMPLLPVHSVSNSPHHCTANLLVSSMPLNKKTIKKYQSTFRFSKNIWYKLCYIRIVPNLKVIAPSYILCLFISSYHLLAMYLFIVDLEKENSLDINLEKECICWDGLSVVNWGPRFYE